tara:strand:- start:869 stop:1099 length:231 start_codon:yes stop_codon:yes gene_type:complete
MPINGIKSAVFLKRRRIMNNIKEIQLTNKTKLNSAPFVEIVYFNDKEQESFKETYPVSHFLDQNVEALKTIKSVIN